MKQTYDKNFILSRIQVDPVTGCWNWTRGKDSYGYGIANYRMGYATAHRLAFFLWIKPPGDLLVCHKCDNPPCCNPDHLFLGTDKDNMADAASKGRMAKPLGTKPWTIKGEDCYKARLKESDIFAIRNSDKSDTALGREYGVTSQHIGQIRSGRHWKHLLPQQFGSSEPQTQQQKTNTTTL